MFFPKLLPLCLLWLSSSAAAFEYVLTLTDDTAISCTDVKTMIADVKTLFNGETVSVKVSGLAWEELESANQVDSLLQWQTFVGDKLSSEGTYDLTTFGRQLPDSLEVGKVTVNDSGSHTIVVMFNHSGYVFNQTLYEELGSPGNEEVSRIYQSYPAAVSIIPLIVVLVLAMTTQMVEFSLFVTVFIGACIITGEINAGFKSTLSDYILVALADVDHGYVYLFSLFLSGLVAMLQKSGGMIGFTNWIAKFATTPRAAQVAVFCVTLLCFFDDYTNLLLTGQSMSALADVLMVSKEKLTFVVDATAAPLASLTPVSSWVGFEINLISTEIDNLIAIYGEENLTISTSAMTVFLQSIKYRYYPIFMLILIPCLILFQKDFGPMLLAERRVRVHERTDGGDGRVVNEEGEGGETISKENEPDKDIPYRTWNMLVPVLLLIFFIFFLMVRTGDDGTGTLNFIEKIENADAYSALLWGTMATAILTTIMYSLQIVQDGHYVLPTLPVLKSCLCGSSSSTSADKAATDPGQDKLLEEEQDAEPEESLAAKNEAEALIGPEGGSQARSLMSIYECVESFLFGMGRLFPALIVLTLAWATGDIMTSVGADRLFSQIITGGIAAEAMPTISFIIAVLMALATGSSWSTMTILFPLIMVPTYQVTLGMENQELIFYATVAGVLSGSVAGDHMSPISDTTVISAMSCGCKLLNHVITQAPYATLVVLICVCFGTIPIGRNAMPNIVGILLGAVFCILFVFFVCAPVVHPTGRYDWITELFMMCRPNPNLLALKEETKQYSEAKAAAADGNEGVDEKENNEDDGATDAKAATDSGDEPQTIEGEEPQNLEVEVDSEVPAGDKEQEQPNKTMFQMSV